MMRVPRKYFNLLVLTFSFGLGQGSLFLANTWLYIHHKYTVIANFGISNAIITFLLFIVDWGGLFFLAREVVAETPQSRSVDSTYIALSLFRFCVATIIISAINFFIFKNQNAFVGGYLRSSSIGMAFYAFNTNGILDGRGKSGVSGLTQAMPILFTAIALPFSASRDPAQAGLLLGAIFSGVYLLAIMVQIVFAAPDREAIRGLRFVDVPVIAFKSFPYMMSPLPAQALYRLQILIAGAWLAQPLVALFIYCRQIIGIGLQGVGLYLRVDWKDFAAMMSGEVPGMAALLVRTLVVRIALASSLLVEGVALCIAPFDARLAEGLAIYAPCILTLSVTSTLQRVFLIKSRSYEAVFIIVLSTVLGLVFLLKFNTMFITSVVLVEIGGHLIQILLFACRWRKDSGIFKFSS